MKQNTLIPVLILAVMVFSAPRCAAAFDFNGSSEPLALASAAPVPEAPAPVPAAPKPCKPFLISVSVGGVSERVVLERACTPENDPVWAITVERGSGNATSVRVASDKYPAEREKLEKRIQSMAVDGISQKDADFIVMKTGDALKQAEAADPRKKSRILFAATEELKEHLAKP